MQVVRSLEPSAWLKFVDNHPHGNIFHTPEMFRVFSQARNHKPDLWAVVDESQLPLALMLPVRLTLFPPLKLLTTRSVVYGSVLYAPSSQGSEALDLLLKTYCREGSGPALFTELRNLSDLGKVQTILQAHGFIYQDEVNFLINLNRSPDDLLQSIGTRTRKHIRQGLRRSALEIKPITERDALEEWYRLLAKTYRRARVPLADRSLFQAALDILVPKKMAVFLEGRINGQLAAVSLELMHKHTIFGMYSGVNRDFSRHTPSELMMWKILKYGAENGFRTYDFGLAGSPDKAYGVRDFKAKFNGSQVCYGRNTCVHHPRLFKLSRWGFALYRRFRR